MTFRSWHDICHLSPTSAVSPCVRTGQDGEMGISLWWGRGCFVIKFVILEGVWMSEETKKRSVEYILCRLLETATGMKLIWLDLATGRAMFQFSPTEEQVTKFLESVPAAGKA